MHLLDTILKRYTKASSAFGLDGFPAFWGLDFLGSGCFDSGYNFWGLKQKRQTNGTLLACIKAPALGAKVTSNEVFGLRVESFVVSALGENMSMWHLNP